MRILRKKEALRKLGIRKLVKINLYLLIISVLMEYTTSHYQ